MTILFASNWRAVLAQIALGFLAALPSVLAAISTDDLEAMLAQAVLDAMHAAHVPFKAMASAMGIDEAQFRRQLAREHGQHLSIYRVLHCPFAWWLHFGPALMLIVWTSRWRELAHDGDAVPERRRS